MELTMGVCRSENGFRGFLEDLAKKEAPKAEKDRAFAAIKSGDTDAVITLIKAHPGLLQQKSDEKTNPNIVIAILNNIRRPQIEGDPKLNPEELAAKRSNLIKLINTIIKHHKEKLDLGFQDENGNTALHKAFWFAITEPDEATSKEFTKIGLEFIGLIKDGFEFKQIVARKNNYQESFLQNLYMSREQFDDHLEENPGQNEALERNLKYVQEQVGPVLNPYKRSDKADKTEIDFKEKGFRERLEELLTDPVTLELIVNPKRFTGEGHTLGAETWSQLKPPRNPLTQRLFKPNELVPNTFVARIVDIFKDNLTKKKSLESLESLVQEMTDYVDRTSKDFVNVRVDEDFESDLLTKHIKELLTSYARQLKKGPEVVQAAPVAQGVQPPAVTPKTQAPKYTQAVPQSSQVAQGIPPQVAEVAKASVAPAKQGSNDRSIQIKAIVDELHENIKGKAFGRKEWFHHKSESKREKLTAISDWLLNNPVDGNNEKIILALIRDVCAIKRNPVGFSEPHSLTEFKMKLGEKPFKALGEIPINEDLSRLEKGKDSADFIDELIPSPSVKLNT